MTIDRLASIEMTASIAAVVGTYAALFGRTIGQRVLIGGALVLWLAVVLTLGATEFLHLPQALGTLGLGMAVLLPIVVLSLMIFRSPVGRGRALEAPMSALIGVQAIRILGINFVLLYAAHRLPAPFAPVAGWGDVLIGAAALPIALWVARPGQAARIPLILWNVAGLLDLMSAIFLGATSAPGPIRLFFAEPGSSIMTTLPWILIPCFLVPALAAMHLVVFYRIRVDPMGSGGGPIPRGQDDDIEVLKGRLRWSRAHLP